MITKLRGLILPLLFACTAVHAQAPEATGESGSRNHFFFHPIITVLSMAIDPLPLIVSVTYERNLESVGNSLMWQPQLMLGDNTDGDVRFTQFGTTQYLGLRHYFPPRYGGFYVQGSGAFTYSRVSAKQKGDPNEVNGTVDGVGALAYLGYRWAHVYLDLGLGYQGVQGDLTLDTGEEVSVAATGPMLDFNLGFGF
jgi:hypothetical protein